MKNSLLRRNTLLAVVVALLLVFCIIPAWLPQTAMAGATAFTINYPSSTNITYVKTGGWVNVSYNIAGSGTTTYAIVVTNATLGTAGSTGTLSHSAPVIGMTTPVLITGTTAGTYDVQISCSDNPSASTTNTSAVVVDNTAPTVSVILPTSGTCWKDGTAQYVQWTAADNNPGGNVTITANLSTDGGATYPNSIITAGSYTQGAQSYTYTHTFGTSYPACIIEIKAVDLAGNDSGWHYSQIFPIIATGPAVSVTSPTSGVAWNGGSSQTITATITGTGTTVYYSISLKHDSATDCVTSSWQPATLTGSVYSLSYPWTVSNSVRSSNCQILVDAWDCAGNASQGQSGTFRIVDVTAPTCSVTAHTTGTTWYASSSSNIITWTQADNVPGNLMDTLQYSPDGGTTWFPTPITSISYPQGTNSYSWSIPPGINSTNCQIKLTCCDAETPANCTSAISSTFTISAPCGILPTVTVCAPAAGASLQGGTQQTITWSANSACDPNLRLTYAIYSDNGTGWVLVATLPNQLQSSSCGCSYNWVVPNPNISTSWQIEVIATDPSSNSATGVSGVFTVTPNPCDITSTTITLYAGWNLISLPLVPVSTDINSVLSGVLPCVLSVWYYSGGPSGTWYSYAPGAPSGLTTMVAGNAYWVNMAPASVTCVYPMTLTITGRRGTCPPNPLPSYSYVAGWNMVGYRSMAGTPHTVQAYLGGTCSTTYAAPIICWTASGTPWWCSKACGDSMASGSGYWVYFNAPTTITDQGD